MSATVIPVLLYHAVNDRPRTSASWGVVSRAEFAAHVDVIARSGRQPVQITTLAGALRGEHALPERPVAITFDDGYLDTYDAVALLASRGLLSTVYVTTANIGALDRLSAAQVVDLARAPGVEVGAHAVHHRRLDELDDSELTEEIRHSKAALENLTGGRVGSFAYPHGAYDRRVRAAVVAAGYRSATAVKNAVSHLGDDPFAISRWTVTRGTSAQRIAQVLEGEHMRLASSRERLRTRAYRTARRQRRRLLEARSAPS
jgi:peptidoglycan/xylan/chitin deacetylase (PgdA/CDA1 family)